MIDLSPDDRVILDRMLTQLASRLDGAIDFWTLVCLDSSFPQRQEFLAHHGEVLQSLVVAVRELFQGKDWANTQPAANLFEAMCRASEKVANAFSILEQL